MFILNNDKTIYCDIDDSLIAFGVINPETPDSSIISISCNGTTENYEVLWDNVQALKEFKQRGFGVVLWTQSPIAWAIAVAEALKLENYIDVVACKPMFLIDDLPASEFMPKSRLYNKE